jgi:hypothetical protein
MSQYFSCWQPDPGTESRAVDPAALSVLRNGSLLWPVLPLFQYAYYAHLAYRRLKKAAVVSTALHYGSEVALIACFRNSGSQLPEPTSSSLGTDLLAFAFFYGPLLALNVYFFVRIFQSRS